MAVDNIRGVQENAVLERLAMQVNLVLDVEKLMPDFLRRKFMVQQETVLPNKRLGVLSSILNDNGTLNRISLSVVENGNQVRGPTVLLVI